MINTRTIIFYDFETGSLNPHKTQPLELAALAIDPRKLEVISGSLFHAKIKPLVDDDAIARELDPVQKTALAVNHITIEELQNCPSEEQVWNSFVDYTYQWNPKKSAWEAPIAAGFNITHFDSKIVQRLCKAYGPFDNKKEQQKVFNPMQAIDLRDIMWLINENSPDIEGNSMDAIRGWMGIPTEGAHSANIDVEQGAELLCKMMRLIRYWSSRTTFKW